MSQLLEWIVSNRNFGSVRCSAVLVLGKFGLFRIGKNVTKLLPNFWRWNTSEISFFGSQCLSIERNIGFLLRTSPFQCKYWIQVYLSDTLNCWGSIANDPNTLPNSLSMAMVRSGVGKKFLARLSPNFVMYYNSAWLIWQIALILISYRYSLYRTAFILNA